MCGHGVLVTFKNLTLNKLFTTMPPLPLSSRFHRSTGPITPSRSRPQIAERPSRRSLDKQPAPSAKKTVLHAASLSSPSTETPPPLSNSVVAQPLLVEEQSQQEQQQPQQQQHTPGVEATPLCLEVQEYRSSEASSSSPATEEDAASYAYPESSCYSESSVKGVGLSF